MITVLGLGPGDPGLLTRQAERILREVVPAGSASLVLRTRVHPTVAQLDAWGVPYESHDARYDASADFDEVYGGIVADLLARARVGPVVYAVPGHPRVGEKTVAALLAQTEVPVELVAGMSALDALWAVVGHDPMASVRVVDALDLATDPGSPFEPAARPLDPVVPTLALHVYNPRIAAEAKLPLLELFPPEHPVTVVRAAGVPGEERVQVVPLAEVDRVPWTDHLTSWFLPAAEPVGVPHLARIVARLRSPDGCPWDREQTPASLTRYVLEEAYEVVDAIERDDLDGIEEELGDLLLQVVLQSQIAAEAGDFTLQDVAEGICAKLVRRHPHVFGDERVEGASGVLARWEDLKAAEKAAKGEAGPRGILEGIPGNLPALSWADKLNRKAARAGFEWKDFGGVLAKVQEEAAELTEAAEGMDRRAIAHEVGDLFLAMTNLARWLEIDPEDALRQANRRFIRRFTRLEELAGHRVEGRSLEELLDLWRQAKEIVG